MPLRYTPAHNESLPGGEEVDEGDAGQGHSELWYALKGLTEHRGLQREDLLEALEGELSALQRCWGINLKNGLKVAKDTIGINLYAHFQRITPPEPGPNPGRRKKPLSPEEHLRRYWECVRASFNMGLAKSPELLEMNITERRKWLDDPARGKMQVSASTRQRYLNDTITQIEQQIIATGYIPVSYAEAPDEEAAHEAAVVSTLTTEHAPQSDTQPDSMSSSESQSLGGQPLDIPKRPSWKPVVLAGAVLATAAASIGGTALVVHLLGGHGAARTISNTTPKPAAASSQPVLIESVSPLTSDDGRFFVVPGKLDMTPAELATFNNNIFDNPDLLASWFTVHKAISVGNSSMKITMAGNVKGEAIRITDIRVVKQCHVPSSGGTIFASPGQGEPENIPMGFDLDSPVTIAQNEDFSTTTGPGSLLGTKFFDLHTISLGYNESETLNVDMHTTSDCTFTLQLVVATTSGTLTEKVDDNGKPFEIAALPKPSDNSSAYATYQAEYLMDTARGKTKWVKVDPRALNPDS